MQSGIPQSRTILLEKNVELQEPTEVITTQDFNRNDPLRLTLKKQGQLQPERRFLRDVMREFGRAQQHNISGCLVYLELPELPQILVGIEKHVQSTYIEKLINPLFNISGIKSICCDEDNRIGLLFSHVDIPKIQQQLNNFARETAIQEFYINNQTIRITPAIGLASFADGNSAGALRRQALIALSHSNTQRDLLTVRYEPILEGPLPKPPNPGLMDVLNQVQYPEWFRLLIQVLITIVIGLNLPFVIDVFMALQGKDLTPVIYLIVVLSLVVTSYLVWSEGLHAIRPETLPAKPGAPYPQATAVIAAYLPNEAPIVMETIEAFLRIDYPGPFQILLAYNTPRDLPIEKELRALAQRDPRFELLRVEGSTSKAQNINAALSAVRGEFIGIFDADHQPAPYNFTRAWHWLSNGYDIVQGHCVIRNGDESWIARLIAIEFESIYAVSHPGRSRLHGFGIFGGSNGYWKTDLLRQIRMRSHMLTEDIDSTFRALLSGANIKSDPNIISRELAPVTIKTLWNQRMRWAQGWFQVSRKHMWPALESPHLNNRQKWGIFHLLGWREIYPWIAIQIIPILAFRIWWYGLEHLPLFVPIFVLTTLFAISSSLGQTLFAYLFAVPEIRRRRDWFYFYFFASLLFYAEFKNLISRVAIIKEVLNEQVWKVTPRTTNSTSSQGASES